MDSQDDGALVTERYPGIAQCYGKSTVPWISALLVIEMDLDGSESGFGVVHELAEALRKLDAAPDDPRRMHDLVCAYYQLSKPLLRAYEHIRTGYRGDVDPPTSKAVDRIAAHTASEEPAANAWTPPGSTMPVGYFLITSRGHVALWENNREGVAWGPLDEPERVMPIKLPQGD